MPGSSNYDDEFTPGFWEKNRAMFIVVGLVLVVGILIFFKMRGAKSSPPPRAERMTMITLPPPPTPPPRATPPPPPPVNTPPPEKMEQQAPVEKPEDKPAPPKPKNDEPPDQPLGTNLKGPGGDSFGLGSGSGAGGGGGGRAGGSKWGWYAGQVQTKIADALRKNSRTKGASLRIDVQVWPDSSGRIVRAKLISSSGDQAVDDAIQNEVLSGLQLQEAPPAGMPLPIVLRLTARRPN